MEVNSSPVVRFLFVHLDFCECLFPNGLLVFVLNIRHSQVISPAAFNIAKEEEAYSECLDAVPPALLHNNKSFNLQPFCLSQVCQIPVFPLIFLHTYWYPSMKKPKTRHECTANPYCFAERGGSTATFSLKLTDFDIKVDSVD